MASEDTQTANPAEEQEQAAAEATAENPQGAQETDEKEEKEDNSTGEISAEEKLEAELAEQKDKYLRLYSEFENYRRRTSKEKLDLVKTANEDLIKELLPVLDDLERAAQNNTKEGVELASVLEGNNLIQNKLVRALEGKGLKKLDIGAGSEFDTEFQEAITQIPAPQEDLKGKVVDCVEPGYTLGEKVIRYAKVVTGS
ncbi:MAG TPA: nucleotide exchange factor GrpE [Cytophagales bacterium]|nr:nucleotide exchange factor GrpE [Cytophagales bacterium]HAA23278.1 nucleotide exchange factor GrpE [Cytophagales bacterium]HAP61849.1 nucleotide exchange factor GrpE [Cytophagales bacterium]